MNFIDILKKLNELKTYTSNNEFDKIKTTTLNIEKEILDNYKSTDFKRLLENITFYSKYSLFNTLLVDFQYPNYLELGTEQKYLKNGFKLSDNAKPINILAPDNDVYVKIKNNNEERIELLSNLNEEELNRYNDKDDKSITLHHKEFKGLNIIELFDCKDTTMQFHEYKTPDLPALLHNDYKDIYNSFIKAMYADGYKIQYCNNLDSKLSYDKNNNIINIKKGLNNKTTIHSLLDMYSHNNTDNLFEKELLKHVINKGLGIDDNFEETHDITNWYKNTDIKNVDKTLKLISSKGRKFIDNFNRFFDMEEKQYTYENVSLYNDYTLTM